MDQTWVQEPQPSFSPPNPPCSSRPTPQQDKVLRCDPVHWDTCSRRHSKNTLLLSTMLMYSASSSPHPATFLRRSFRPAKSAAWKTSKLTLNLLARGTYVYFSILVEVEELVEEVGELLHLEGWEEPLQLSDVADIVVALRRIVASDHRAHLARELSHSLLEGLAATRMCSTDKAAG